MPSAAAGFDVAIAADFSSPLTAVRAEVQTLFFLGSWLERAGQHTRETCPLHLACVGNEPPDSVAALAARAGARVSVHEPLTIPEVPENGRRAFHRLRALDAGPFATDGRVLLLDNSVLVLGDPFSTLAGLPADALASSPAERALLPNAGWPALYRALDLEPPTTRMRALRAELELPPRPGPPAFEDQAAESAAMFPCYDAGVLFLPAAAAPALRELWPAHAAALARCLAADPNLPLAEKPRAKLAGNLRISLATAHQALLAGGGAVKGWRRLPAGCDARLAHFQGGALEFDAVKLLRAGEFFQGLTDPSQIQARLRAAGDLWRSAIVEGRQRNAGIDRWADEGARARLRRWRAGRASRQAERWLRELYVRHVRPSLRAAGEYV